MSHYLLPCRCGQKVVVEPAQAGQTIPCRCGQPLPVPTLLAMRQLAPAPVDADASSGRWELPQQLLFLAVLATIVSLCLGVTAIVVHPAPITFDTLEDTRASLDRLTLRQTMVVWMHLSQGPNAPLRPGEKQYALDAANFRFWLILAILSTLGAAGFYVAAWITSRASIGAGQTDTAPGSPPATGL